MSDTNQLPPLPAPIRWIVSGALRHAASGLGVALLAAHVLPNQTAEQQFINWAFNGLLIIGGLGWSFLNEKSKHSSNS